MILPFKKSGYTFNYPVRPTSVTEVTYVDGLGYVVRSVDEIADDLLKYHADTYTFENLMRTDPSGLNFVNPTMLQPTESDVNSFLSNIDLSNLNNE